MPPIYNDKEMCNHLQRVVRDGKHWIFVTEGPDSPITICLLGFQVWDTMVVSVGSDIDRLRCAADGLRYGSLTLRLPTKSGIVSFLSAPKDILNEDVVKGLCRDMLGIDIGEGQDIIFLHSQAMSKDEMEESMMGQLIVAAYNGRLLTNEMVESN